MFSLPFIDIRDKSFVLFGGVHKDHGGGERHPEGARLGGALQHAELQCQHSSGKWTCGYAAPFSCRPKASTGQIVTQFMQPLHLFLLIIGGIFFPSFYLRMSRMPVTSCPSIFCTVISLPS